MYGVPCPVTRLPTAIQWVQECKRVKHQHSRVHDGRCGEDVLITDEGGDYMSDCASFGQMEG